MESTIPYSPTAALGTITLYAAFVVAAFTLAIGILGSRRRSNRLTAAAVSASHGFTMLMVLASALIVYAFLSHDYAIKYVAFYSDTTMPFWYKITAYWGGLDGSLMFWVFVLSMFSSVAVHFNRARHRDMIGYVVATVMVVQLFFLAILVFYKDPFATFLTEPPLDGKGLNPLLQNYWMVIHPPSLYIGFVAATIPFAFCVGALASGRLDDAWIYSIRVWMLICWFFLSFGLILGGRWAYEELGWGGYWAWDPVENAGFLPWFTASAVLHSFIIQEQRGTMKVWNVVLVALTFFMTIFGTFMTRSGVVQSVHAFGEDNKLAMAFIVFMAFIWIFSVGFIVLRLPRLKTKGSFDSFTSREFAFVLNNWILLGSMLFVLFATMFPTISEAVTGERITIGPPFFNRWMTPLGLVLVFLAGAAPLLAWRKTASDRLRSQFAFPTAFAVVVMGVLALIPDARSNTPILVENFKLPVAIANFGVVAFTLASIAQEFWKGVRVRRSKTGSDPFTSLIGITLAKRRRYGGYLVHAGVAVMFIGFAGKAYEVEKDFTLQSYGETFAVRDYQVRYDKFVKGGDDHKTEYTAHMTLFRDGAETDQLLPARWVFSKLPDQPTTEPAVSIQRFDDVYIVLLGFQEGAGDNMIANFRIYVNPLVNWVWLGFIWLMFGTAVCLVPQSVADRLRGGVRTRTGALADRVGMALLIGAVVTGTAMGARAQSQPGGSYEEVGHNTGANAASMYRPEHTGSAEGEELSRDLMNKLGCMCGSCPKEAIVSCDCGFAAQMRSELLGILSGRDLSKGDVREQARKDVLNAMVTRFGQEVLTSPIDSGFNRLSWLVPMLGIAGSLVLIFAVGRRWVSRGSMSPTAAAAAAVFDDDDDLDEYDDMLDDELAESD